MATALDLFPSRVRFVGDDGRLTAEAVRALNTVFARVGGASGSGTSDLAISDDEDSGLEEFKAETCKTIDGLQMVPFADVAAVVDPLLSELAGLRERVAVLSTQINDLQQGMYP